MSTLSQIKKSVGDMEATAGEARELLAQLNTSGLPAAMVATLKQLQAKVLALGGLVSGVHELLPGVKDLVEDADAAAELLKGILAALPPEVVQAIGAKAEAAIQGWRQAGYDVSHLVRGLGEKFGVDMTPKT